MPYKDPAKMAEYMRNRRMKMKNQGVNDKVNVNPVNPHLDSWIGKTLSFVAYHLLWRIFIKKGEEQ